MNAEMVLGLVRHLATFAGGWVVSQGWATDADAQTGIGAIVALIGLGWSFWAKRAAK